MDINELTLKQIKEIQSLSLGVNSPNKSAYKIGEKYFIRTITYHCVGLLKEKFDNELVLESASWIADSGRLNNALSTGVFDEIEPFTHDLIVNINSITDATVFSHKLPREVK